jgi:hypothetical protein
MILFTAVPLYFDSTAKNKIVYLAVFCCLCSSDT